MRIPLLVAFTLMSPLAGCVSGQGPGSGSGAVVHLHANIDGRSCGFKSDSAHLSSGPSATPLQHLTVSGSECCESFGWKFVGWYDTDGPTRMGTGRAGMNGNGYAAVCVPESWAGARAIVRDQPRE